MGDARALLGVADGEHDHGLGPVEGVDVDLLPGRRHLGSRRASLRSGRQGH
jgi:hypothetical protein